MGSPETDLKTLGSVDFWQECQVNATGKEWLVFSTNGSGTAWYSRAH